MNVVDSSGWLEFFADGLNADFFAPAIENVPDLVVPSLSLYEVFKRVLQQRGEDEALQAVAVMAQGRVVDLTMTLAIHAAKLSVDLRLPMADSIILATAHAYHAILWAQDADFRGLEGGAVYRKACLTEPPNPYEAPGCQETKDTP
jgi:toxin FitB